MKREVGFYWVMYELDEWTVGHYDDGWKRPWSLVGSYDPISEDELHVIGDKIDYPAPQ
jgi:hypothetical protein